MKKVFVLIFFCFLLTGCKKEPDKNFYMDLRNQMYEIYNDIYLEDLILDTNSLVKNGKKLINTSELGIFKETVEFTYKKKKYTKEIEYEVIDTVPPKIFSTSSKTVYLDSKTEVCNLALIGDNYDKNPECEIVGDYSLSEKGTYDLKYDVTDSSGNKASFSFKLKVIEKPKATSSNSNSTTETKYLDFNDVLNNYKTADTEIGIDVSKWQGDIDFQAVKEAGAEFVFIRIGVHAGLGYDIVEDPYFATNIKNAKEAGLKIGVYFYSTATSIEESVEHANWVIDKLDGEKLDLPIAFDWENWNYWNLYPISFYDINIIAEVFIQTIQKSGYEGVLYSSKNYLETIWTPSKFNYPIWLAHYTSQTSYEGDYAFWQISEIGKIDGINGHVDINIFYK